MHRRMGAGLVLLVALLASCSTSRSDSSTPSARPTPAPAVRDYDLGSVELDGGGKRADFPVRGIVAVPADPAGAPVAVVLHMAGVPCTDRTEQLPCQAGKDARFDRGMAWLVTDLAARGYVAIAPDLTKTRDFRYETVTVPLGWQLADVSLTRLRADPTAFGLAAGAAVSDTTVAVGHSVGGDSAMWWAVDRPGDIAAAVLLQPAPLKPGLFPRPASPYAYPNEATQTTRIPTDLPFAVVMGRCDDDAGYSGGLYVVNATVDPERTAPTVAVFLPAADHLMLNTRALRTTSPPQAGCPEPSTPEHAAQEKATRAEVGPWVADVLDTFLGRTPLHSVDDLDGASVVRIPPASQRATVMLPMGGALGADGLGGRDVEDPAAGSELGVSYDAEGLVPLVCAAGGVVPIHAEGREPCTAENAERPGFGPALYLRPTSTEGTWSATMPAPVDGELMLTLAADPADPPLLVRVRAGDVVSRVAGDALAVATAGPMTSDRTVPRQVRILLTAPVTRIDVTIEGGGVFLQDVWVVPPQPAAPLVD